MVHRGRLVRQYARKRTYSGTEMRVSGCGKGIGKAEGTNRLLRRCGFWRGLVLVTRLLERDLHRMACCCIRCKDKRGFCYMRINGECLAWPLTTIPVASARLTDELFNRDAPMQFHPALRRERSVACPAPDRMPAVDFLAHASVVTLGRGLNHRENLKCTRKDGCRQVNHEKPANHEVR
jgi:hypothetical protein